MTTNRPVQLPRRALLRIAGLSALVLPGTWSRPAKAKGRMADEIAQPDRPRPRAFIDRAFEMRRQAEEDGDQAFGAVVVRNNAIVGRDLSGCILYSSSKPCPMCEAAAYWAGIERLTFGHDIADGGAPRLCG
jgi:hypothetical protein